MSLMKAKTHFTAEDDAVNGKKTKELAMIGCTVDEICHAVNISLTTLYKRYRSDLKEGQWLLRKSLKRKQVELALAGDRTMLVWLGKQYLGQRDKHEIDATLPQADAGNDDAPPTIVIELVEARAPNADSPATKQLPPPTLIKATGTTPIK